MFTVIYQFKLKQDKADEFIKAWEELTELIYNHAGSLGSSLHKQDEDTYIAYAQWPDKETFETSSNKLPNKAKEVSENMKNTCLEIMVLHQMTMVKDLLK